MALVTPDAPLGLQNLNGVLDISNDKVNVTQLTGDAGGGQILARGVIGYRPQLQMNLALQGKNVRIRYQDAIRTVLESELNLMGTSKAANLTGRVLINSLSFTPNFDLASLAGQVQSGPESPHRTSAQRTADDHHQPVQLEFDLSGTARQDADQLCLRPAAADGRHH